MGLFGRLKKRIEQEKDKIKSCQTNIVECRRRKNANMKNYIDGHKRRIEEIKKTIAHLKEEIADIRKQK